MVNDRHLTFKPDKFYEELFDELQGWMQEGITDLGMLLEDTAHDRSGVQLDVQSIHRDGNNIVVIDVSGGLHMFRMRLERL